MATSYCSRCGSPLPSNARFCANCGAVIVPLGPATAASATPPSPAYAIPQRVYASDDLTPMESLDRPTGAGILTIIGSIFILLGGIVEVTIGSAISAVTLGQAGGGLVGLGALGILMGILILIFGILILASYESVATYGILVIIFSLISLASFLGGFVIGFILALIGGILAITWEP